MPHITKALLCSGRIKTQHHSNFRSIKKKEGNAITVYRHMIGFPERQM